MSEPTLVQTGHKVAAHILSYPFRKWGFGEEIALRALVEFDAFVPSARYATWVHGLVLSWVEGQRAPSNADHVAPGSVLVDLYRRTGEQEFLDAAIALGRLYLGFPRVDGVPIHRPDLNDWSATIWVDCLPIDAPFLFRLAAITGDADWAEVASEHLRTYAEVLWDPAAQLFVHGYDAAGKERSPVHWARGNGWALVGLVDVLEVLPPSSENAKFARRRARTLAQTLIGLQSDSGAWHTVLDDRTSPLEGSTSALFGFALTRARRMGFIEVGDQADQCIDRAMRDVKDRVGASGALLVSSATPVGTRSTYVDRDLGVFPWGQGPALLAITERLGASVDATQEETP